MSETLKVGAKRIAVVGGGVAGIVSAYLLSRKNQVTIYDANSYLGGHTNTIAVEDIKGRIVNVDTGFIVLNDQNYPLFHEFLSQLGVKVRWSDMSFGYHCERTRFQYGGTSLNGLFGRRSSLISPGFWYFLSEIKRFSRLALATIEANKISNVTLEEFIRNNKFKEDIVRHYIVPICAAIWSCGDKDIFKFSIDFLFRFLKNHGLLSLHNRPKWQTVINGSHSYVEAFKKHFSGRVKLNTAITKITRSDSEVKLISNDGKSATYDYVVIATHADQVLPLLDMPTGAEEELFKPWRYQKNLTVLHWDESVLPKNRRVWASWNYLRRGDILENSSVEVTYHMNRLQGIQSNREYCVSLNLSRYIDRKKIIKEIEYSHPSMSIESTRTQAKLPALNSLNRTFYCGSYFGFGFHEDAVRSAVKVGECFGEQL